MLWLFLGSLLWSLWPPQSQRHPWLHWPFCSRSSLHLPGFLSVSLQLMWARGHWSLTDWWPQVRDLPVAVSTRSYVGHLLGFSGAARAGVWPDSPGKSSWGDHGALSSPTTLRAHPLACCSVLAAHLWPPGLWSSLPLSFWVTLSLHEQLGGCLFGGLSSPGVPLSWEAPASSRPSAQSPKLQAACLHWACRGLRDCGNSCLRLKGGEKRPVGKRQDVHPTCELGDVQTAAWCPSVCPLRLRPQPPWDYTWDGGGGFSYILSPNFLFPGRGVPSRRELLPPGGEGQRLGRSCLFCALLDLGCRPKGHLVQLTLDPRSTHAGGHIGPHNEQEIFTCQA